MNFIKTKYEDVAKTLKSLGLQELPKEGNFFVFVNQPEKINFSDNKKIVYTNKLNF